SDLNSLLEITDIARLHSLNIFNQSATFSRIQVPSGALAFGPLTEYAPRQDSTAPYSYRKATNGSTRVALRAGIQQATNAISARRRLMHTNVSGSLDFTPKSSAVS